MSRDNGDRRTKFLLITDNEASEGEPRFYVCVLFPKEATDEDKWALVDFLRDAARHYRKGMGSVWRMLGWKNPAKQHAGALGGLTAAKEMTHEERRERARRGGMARFYGPDGDVGRASALGRLLRLSRRRLRN